MLKKSDIKLENLMGKYENNNEKMLELKNTNNIFIKK